MIEQDVLFNFLRVLINFAKFSSLFSCKFPSIAYLSRIVSLLLAFNFSQENTSNGINFKKILIPISIIILIYSSITFWIEGKWVKNTELW